MKRSSSIGALHPILFLITVYAISVVLAFFVCNVIYNSLHQSSSLAEKGVSKIDNLAVLK
jgi:hypothetical protein